MVWFVEEGKKTLFSIWIGWSSVGDWSSDVWLLEGVGASGVIIGAES